MNIYASSLATLVVANVGLLYYRNGRRLCSADLGNFPVKISGLFGRSSGQAASFKYTFFSVYVLVVASDWLQGAYIYPLYKQTLKLPENVIAALFSTGFISGALSATFVGNLADRHGRRKACLSFCVIYGLSCLMTLSPDSIFLLFMGRFLGGIGTTLLFTVFETWLVAEFHRLRIEGTELSSLLGMMTTLNSIVAIAAGLVSEWLVRATGTRRAPFVASVACLSLAFQAIFRNWGENYGAALVHKVEPNSRSSSDRFLTLIKDKRILGLGVITAVFEGTMYLFVVFWSPAMIAAHGAGGVDPATSSDPPFGLIFASFMTAMMLGSQIFAYLMPPSSAPSSTGNSETTPLTLSSYLLTLLLPLTSSCLSWSIIRPTEFATLWAFCLFELGIGVYFPSMGVLKSLLVEDSNRAKVYALFRVPLNCFVVVGLALTQEGEAYRHSVFMCCSGLLLAVMGFAHLVLK